MPAPARVEAALAIEPSVMLVADASMAQKNDATAKNQDTATPTSTPAPPPATPQIILPSSAAAYLDNPFPPYPPVSRRLREEGKVVLRVHVGAQGEVLAVELKTSSGFSRLDDSALATVPRWRFVPGQRDGIPQAMWVTVPIAFELTST
jgi:protein TonB